MGMSRWPDGNYDDEEDRILDPLTVAFFIGIDNYTQKHNYLLSMNDRKMLMLSIQNSLTDRGWSLTEPPRNSDTVKTENLKTEAVKAEKTKCLSCKGRGTISVGYTHPTNPTLDGWDEVICGVCKGKG